MAGSVMSRTAIFGLGLVLACSGGGLTLPSEPGAPQPASLRLVSGDDQRDDPGALLEEPLTVQVLDAGGQPVADVGVQFSFVDGLPNAGLYPSSTRTDPAGHATALVRLGSVPGELLIAASVAGSESPDLSVRFRAIALEGDDDDDDDDGRRGNKGRGGGRGHDDGDESDGDDDSGDDDD